MFKSKLFDLLSSLDETEYKRFGEFIASPFFNKSKVLIKFHSAYGKFFPVFKDEKFTKENIFKIVFPGKNFSEAVLRNYNSDMLTLAEQFLVYCNISRNANNYHKHLLNELNQRNIHSLFTGNYNLALKTLEESVNRDTSYHFDRYFIKQEKDLFNSYMKSFSAEDKRDSELSFINYFLTVLSEMYAYIINQREVLKIKYEFILFDELSRLIESNSLILDPVVLMHYNRLMLHHTGQEKYYLLLKEQVLKQGSLTDTVNHYDTYICLINYVKKHKNFESMETLRELFELRRIIIEKNILIGKNYLSHNVYHNQVKTGLKLKEFEWVKYFIENFKNKISEDVRDNTYHFCKASYYYETGNNQNSLKHLMLIKGNSDNYPEIKNMTTRIYWRENDFDMLLRSLTSYRLYISKSRKLKKTDVELHAGFIDAVDKMFRCKYDNKKIDLDVLLNKVSCSNIAQKKWVIDEINELSCANPISA